jgi:hypothetical protein
MNRPPIIPENPHLITVMGDTPTSPPSNQMHTTTLLNKARYPLPLKNPMLRKMGFLG